MPDCHIKGRTAQGGIAVFLALVMALFLGGCQQESTEGFSARQDFFDQREAVLAGFSPCERNGSTSQAALVAESFCTEFTVPENYDAPQGRQIDLKLMLIPSLSDFPERDPLVLLAGGPGQAATDLLDAVGLFARTRTDRDIVLLDQRGTGELSPFDCQLDEDEAKALEEQDPGLDELLEIQLDVLRDCLSTMEADPALYTTDIAMRDLDAVRDYIGYSRLNLWGASYGSRAALAYLQAYPENTRAVIIDAIAPTALKLPLYSDRDASASLQSLLDDCAADESCNQAFPELGEHYLELVTRLQTPQPVTYMNDSDFTTVDTTIEAFEFLGLIRQVLYSREAQRLVPLIIEQAWEGNYRPVFALAGQYSEGLINQGMFLSVICNEDVRRLDNTSLAEEAGADYLIKSESFNRFVIDACEFWPKRDVPEDYFEPVAESNPVLIFSGAVDPVTPPVWGELVHEALPNSTHYVLDGFGHGTLFTYCTSAMMNDFIETASLQDLDDECIDAFARRPFFVTPGGSSFSDD